MHGHNYDEHHQRHDADASAIPIERRAICPVTGDAVDRQEAEALGYVREYNGQKYYFCCATCVRLFDKNPQRYV
ncbi:MAG TPA: YHS domain-containing protein [Candidatus Saccharimonadales bacterium]|nr:YHS domain-containing protein [Candidatus Saccharimonadales bacterium]